MKTNEALIFVAGNNVKSATLTPENNYVLIPYNATPERSDEKTSLNYTLYVEADSTIPFTIEHDLPEEFEIVDYDASKEYYTNAYYTITVRLLEEREDNYDFYLYVNFM
jgi:hypothetical protein